MNTSKTAYRMFILGKVVKIMFSISIFITLLFCCRWTEGSVITDSYSHQFAASVILIGLSLVCMVGVWIAVICTLEIGEDLVKAVRDRQLEKK